MRRLTVTPLNLSSNLGYAAVITQLRNRPARSANLSAIASRLAVRRSLALRGSRRSGLESLPAGGLSL